jgi:ABC-type sugar transport system substrate-binding protein
MQSGRRVARLVNEKSSKRGTALLLTARSTVPGQNAISEGRIAGFREAWDEVIASSSTNRFEFRTCSVDKFNPEHVTSDLAGYLADPELSLILAFDAQSAETVLAEMVRHPRTKHITFITFDTTPLILDAIENGIVDSAISEDPYRAGYEALKSLADLCRRDSTSLPMPGRGSCYLSGQVVAKANLRSFR